MRTSADPPDRPLARALRELLPDGNPLRRRCDRVETWIMVALCVMFLVGAPFAAVVAGGYVYGASIRADMTSHPVTAILLSNARHVGYSLQDATALVRWTTTSGDARVDRIAVPVGARAGSVVRAWADASGQLTGAPPRSADVVANVAVAASFALVAVGAVLLSAAVTVRRVMRRRRLAAWEADWRSIEPKWSGGSELGPRRASGM